MQVQSKTTKPKAKNLGGRPKGTTKLTPEIQDKIVAAIYAGNYLETAAAAAGVHKQTFYDWLYKGANAKKGDKTAEIYKRFSDAVLKAMAESEAVAIAAIHQAGMPRDVTKTRTVRKQLIVGDKPVLDENGRPVFTTETVTEVVRETDWRALAWRLERRFNKRWGRREYLETAITEKPIEEMSDAEIDAELNEILEKAEAK